MKTILDPSLYLFNPGIPGVGNLDLSSFGGYQPGHVLAVINNDYNGGTLIYSLAGGTALGSLPLSPTKIEFNYNTSLMSSSDSLTVIYDDPNVIQQVGGSIDANITAQPNVTLDNTVLNVNGITSTINNALSGGPFATPCRPHRAIFVQAKLTGTAQIVIEGSNDNNLFSIVTARKLNDAGSPLNVSWTVTSGDIIAIPIDFAYLRLRVAAISGTLDVFGYFSQVPYTDIIQHSTLVGTTGRAIDYGTGGVSGNTIRVTPASDSTILFPDLIVSSPSGQSALGNNVLTGTTAGNDVTGYRSVGLTITGSAGISAGQVTCEISNDNINWTTFLLIPPSNSTPTPVTGVITVSASTTTYYQASLPFRYFRVRISTGFTGGTVTAIARFSPLHYTGIAVPVIGTVTAAISGSAGLTSTSTTDVNALSVTTTGATGATATGNTQSMSFVLTDVYTTGTGTIDMTIQESYDGGTSWVDLYAFDRISAVGTTRQNVPSIKVNGSHIRYSYVVTGTVTTHTMTLVRVSKATSSNQLRRIYDRTLAPNTLNSTTASLFTEGCEFLDIVVSMGAGGTGPTIQAQGSEDGTNWYNIGTTITATAGATTAFNATDGTLPRFIRALVSAAGTGSTLNYVALKAKGAS